ncbi:MAG: hypothetical protein V4706_14695 [Pseudomonadota bacterium]
MKHAKLLLIGAGAVVGLFLLTKSRGAVAAVGQALNPMSDQNLAYQGASGVGNWLANDGQDRPLGVRVYDTQEALKLDKAQPWEIFTPGLLIGRSIGGFLKEQFGSEPYATPPYVPPRTSDADAQFPHTFTDPYGGTWA